MRVVLPPYLGKTLMDTEEQERVLQVIKSRTLFRYQGDSKECRIVEDRVLSMFSVKHALVIANATCALKVALLSLQPNPGEYVLIPALSYIATANACLACGLIPLCLDVDEKGHLCPDILEGFLENNTKPFAVIAVHLDGATAKISRIKQICEQYSVPLIEDAAQGFGAKHQEQMIGTFGDIGCFSFQENKILSTGEGGLIVTNNTSLFKRICSLTDHGATRNESLLQDWSFDHGYGENFKATELTAALLDVQISRFETMKAALWESYTYFSKVCEPEIERADGDIPISVWSRRSYASPSYNWKYLYLPDHPIIKNRRSPYANGFPWNYSVCGEESTVKAREISEHRISLPIYVDKYQR